MFACSLCWTIPTLVVDIFFVYIQDNDTYNMINTLYLKTHILKRKWNAFKQIWDLQKMSKAEYQSTEKVSVVLIFLNKNVRFTHLNPASFPCMLCNSEAIVRLSGDRNSWECVGFAKVIFFSHPLWVVYFFCITRLMLSHCMLKKWRGRGNSMKILSLSIRDGQPNDNVEKFHEKIWICQQQKWWLRGFTWPWSIYYVCTYIALYVLSF